MNRKCFYYIILGLLLVVLGFFAYKNYKKKPTPHQFPETQVGTTTSISKETTIDPVRKKTRYYELSYDVPSDNETVAKGIKSKAEGWLADTNITNVVDDEQAEREFGIFEGSKYTYDSKYKIEESADYKSYIETVYEFTGGAHGSINNNVYVFFKKDSKQISSLADVYNNNIYNALSSYTRKNLPAHLNKKTIVVSEFQDMFEEGTAPTKENWQTFYFKGEYLVVIFGQYHIGPYAIGIHELEVPLVEIQKYKR